MLFNDVTVGDFFRCEPEGCRCIKLPGKRAIALFPKVGLTKVFHPEDSKEVYQASGPLTYSEAKLLVQNKNEWCKIANNTWVTPSTVNEKAYGIKLHQTEIITIYHDGRYRINHGGYVTHVTCDRIKRLSPLPCKIYHGALWLADKILLSIPMYLTPAENVWEVRNHPDGGVQWKITRE